MSALRRLLPARIRARLTLLYGVVFFVAGAVLVALMMLYLAHALDRQATARIGFLEQLHQSAASDLPRARELVTPHAGFRRTLQASNDLP